jgi:NitT/TauT family transport system ATP-binding protein
VADIAIPGAYPRADNFRTTREYTESCEIVSDALNQTLGSDDIDH